jgi:hypothetical protein
MKPAIQRVNVDFSVDMLKELDTIARELNISRQTVIKDYEPLYKEAQVLVKEGWFRDEKDIFSEAIRRFLDTHRPDLMEKFIRDDVEWGLRGKD